MGGLRLGVTAEDIAGGEKDSPDMCPVALALARALDIGCNCVRVYLDEIVLFIGAYAQVVKRPTPEAVRDWVRRWDAGERVHPFAFVI